MINADVARVDSSDAGLCVMTCEGADVADARRLGVWW